MGARGVRALLATAADQLCGHQWVDGRDVRAVRDAGRPPSAATGGGLAVQRVRAVLRIVGGRYLTGDMAGHRGRPKPLEFYARMAWGVHLDPGGRGVLPADCAVV